MNRIRKESLLSQAPIGSRLKVIRVNSGRMAKRRLANLGLVPGSEVIKTRSAPFRGPIQIKVRGSSLAIGRGIANKIVVEEYAK